MTTMLQAWEAVAPTPVERGTLIEPEATNQHERRPWLHLPPGALAMITGVSVATAAAMVQVSFAEVTHEGLPALLPAPLPEVLPKVARRLPAPISKALERPLATKGEPSHKHRGTRGRLRRALHDDGRTEWSRAG
jgi:hypothetical protein